MIILKIFLFIFLGFLYLFVIGWLWNKVFKIYEDN